MFSSLNPLPNRLSIFQVIRIAAPVRFLKHVPFRRISRWKISLDFPCFSAMKHYTNTITTRERKCTRIVFISHAVTSKMLQVSFDFYRNCHRDVGGTIGRQVHPSGTPLQLSSLPFRKLRIFSVLLSHTST